MCRPELCRQIIAMSKRGHSDVEFHVERMFDSTVDGVGWHNGPPSWGEMERVLTSKPRRAGCPPARADRRRRRQSGLVAQARSLRAARRTAAARSRRLPYAELHAHSAYSFLDGASTPEELVEEAARLNLRAIALTDHDGLYGVVRFAEAARELDVATVFGAELSLGNQPRTEDPDPPGPHLLVLARGPEGYRRLSRELARRTWPAGRRASRATTSTR